MSCPQVIDCCPPTPWDYMIHEQLVTVTNTRQCATASCQDGSDSASSCVEAGQISLTGDISIQDDMQTQVDNAALQKATEQAQALLSCGAASQYWCATTTCLCDGTNVTQYDHSTPCNTVSPGIAQASVPAGAYHASTQVQADTLAQQAAASASQALFQCAYFNDARWWVINCSTGVGSCQTTDPGNPANSAVGHVPARTSSCTSTISCDDANQKACNLAKQLANNQGICTAQATLSNLIWAMPCHPVGDPTHNVCQCTNPIDVVRTVSGGDTSGRFYTAVLRIRGCVELKAYNGSNADSTVFGDSNNFALIYAGDVFPPGSGPGEDPSNRYLLIIDTPGVIKQTFALNWLGPGTLGRTNGQIYVMDNGDGTGTGYTLTVQVKVGTTVTLRADNVDTLQARADFTSYGGAKVVKNNYVNNGKSYPLNPAIYQGPDDANNPTPYVGQWLQMDCMSIT